MGSRTKAGEKSWIFDTKLTRAPLKHKPRVFPCRGFSKGERQGFSPGALPFFPTLRGNRITPSVPRANQFASRPDGGRARCGRDCDRGRSSGQLPAPENRHRRTPRSGSPRERSTRSCRDPGNRTSLSGSPSHGQSCSRGRPEKRRGPRSPHRHRHLGSVRRPRTHVPCWHRPIRRTRSRWPNPSDSRRTRPRYRGSPQRLQNCDCSHKGRL